MTRSREPCVRTWGQRLSIRRGQGAETNVNTQFLSFHANTRLEKTFREAIHPVSPLHFTNKGRGPCLALRLPGATPAQGCLAQTVGDKASPASGGVRRTTETPGAHAEPVEAGHLPSGGWGREGRTGPQQSPEPDGDAELVEAGHLPSGGAGKGGEPSLGEATEAKPGRGRDRGVK